MMIIRVIEARYISGYTVKLRFNDGTEGEADLRNELSGEVFEPLKNIQTFRKFNLHPDLHTLTWPNGADIAPEYLHELVQSQTKRRPKAA